MAKYLARVSYTAEGARGLIKEGGSNRRAAIQKLIESMGGTLEAFYFAYGEDDAYLIMDMNPGDGLALSLVVNSAGAASVSTVPLITAEEVDAACRKTVPYRAPGA